MEIGANIVPMHPDCRCAYASYLNKDKLEEDTRSRGLYSDSELYEMEKDDD